MQKEKLTSNLVIRESRKCLNGDEYEDWHKEKGIHRGYHNDRRFYLDWSKFCLGDSYEIWFAKSHEEFHKHKNTITSWIQGASILSGIRIKKKKIKNESVITEYGYRITNHGFFYRDDDRLLEEKEKKKTNV